MYELRTRKSNLELAFYCSKPTAGKEMARERDVVAQRVVV